MNTPNLSSISRALNLSEDFRHGTKIYDMVAAIPVIAFFGFGAIFRLGLLHKQLSQLDFSHPKFQITLGIIFNITAMVLAALFAGLLFARRPAIAGVKGVWPRVVAFLGTFLSFGILFAPSREVSPAVLTVSTFLEVGGTAFCIYSLAWLGRSISMLAEARKLVTGGPYTIARHPLYLGEEIALLGAVMQFFSPWAVAVLVAQFACQIYRMNYEERILADSFPDYSLYKSNVARLIPGIY